MEFTAEEYTEMIIAYGAAGRNARAAARLYAEQFPGRDSHPAFNTILRCVQRTRETGFVGLSINQRYAGRVIQHQVHEEERVLRAFEEDPGLSVCRAAEILHLPRCMVHRVLQRNGLHHYQRVQQLLPGDYEQRVHFCEGFLAQCRRNNLFSDRIIYSLTVDGRSNFYPEWYLQ
ncbi:uncharacterized protein [Anoplolepis gracilipes]|uniref:uncharacterized protein n=1 Tax=Anoplolepis gracilipes TaxID=354296 RepID=UPI003B9FF43F